MKRSSLLPGTGVITIITGLSLNPCQHVSKYIQLTRGGTLSPYDDSVVVVVVLSTMPKIIEVPCTPDVVGDLVNETFMVNFTMFD